MIIDLELLRTLAILEGHFDNFWNISFSTCKTIVSLDKLQDFDIFLEKIFLIFRVVLHSRITKVIL